MLALAVSDIHDRPDSLEKIMEHIHNRGVGLILLLGDLTNFGGREEAEKVLRQFRGIPALGMPGNLDSNQVQQFLEEKGISLHAKKKKIAGIAFIGFGGGLIGSPGLTLSSETEIKLQLKRLLHNEKKAILLTHLPPFGTALDTTLGGKHIGSKAVREAIEEEQPLLHLCGHCHEAAGEERIGKTTSINIGSVKEGRALLLQFGDEIKWEKIQA